MTIIECSIDYPVEILNKERYDYYKECERKSKMTDSEIREEAVRMFKEWAKTTDFNVDIKLQTLISDWGVIRRSPFQCKFLDKEYTLSNLNDMGFVFEMKLNEKIENFLAKAYNEHQKELEKKLVSSISDTRKKYRRMRIAVFLLSILVASLIMALIF